MKVARVALAAADRLGVAIWADCGRIRYRAPGRMPADLLARLREHKGAILAILAGSDENRPSRLPCAGRNGAGRPESRMNSIQAIEVDVGNCDLIDLCLDGADRELLAVIRDDNNFGPIAGERVLAEPTVLAGVRVPRGWSVAHWRSELRRMADRCEVVRPDRAVALRRDAGRLADAMALAQVKQEAKVET